MTDTPEAFDFAGSPLSVGDRVAFIIVFDGQPALFGGHIALIGKDQVCVEGSSLYVVRGKKWTPTGKPERLRYDTIIRRPGTGEDS